MNEMTIVLFLYERMLAHTLLLKNVGLTEVVQEFLLFANSVDTNQTSPDTHIFRMIQYENQFSDRRNNLPTAVSRCLNTVIARPV